MKRFSKLIPAIVLLLVSAIMMSTATYAWFSMNNRVTVTGMEVKTKVSSNLLIAEDNVEDDFTTRLSQTQKGLLEPVSSINGTAFYYTVDAKATGELSSGGVYTLYNAETAASSATYGNKFSETYNVTKSDALAVNETVDAAVGYIDYVFYLKATNSESASQTVKMTRCNLTYNDGDVSDKAWRVAMFAQTTSKDTSVDTIGDLKTILAFSDATYFTGSSAVNGTTASSKAAVSSLGNEAIVGTAIESGNTVYYKVVIRLWLEGEDNTCSNDTYALLTSNSWKLDLAFELGTANDGVTAISNNAAE